MRRVALQGAFFTIDGMLETWLTVLDEFGAYPAMIEAEIERYLPFLATTKLLMAATRTGMGREEAHEILKKHAVNAALMMREEGAQNSFLDLLSADSDWPLCAKTTQQAIGSPRDFTGLASSQVEAVVNQIHNLCDAYPEAAEYRPEPIL